MSVCLGIAVNLPIPDADFVLACYGTPSRAPQTADSEANKTVIVSAKVFWLR